MGWLLIALIAAGAAGLMLLRLSDRQHDAAIWSRLKSLSSDRRIFSPALVADLPEPARRYFRFSVMEGTPLHRAVELQMEGALSLGSKDRPNFLPMRADQILAGQRGFIWRPRLGSGFMRMSGSDGYHEGRGWTRFWLWSLVPIVRAGGTADFAKSAAARAIAEAVFWLPTSLLPAADVHWEAVDTDTARVVVKDRGDRYAVDLTVDSNGQPLVVVFQRWSRENRQRAWRYQPFGATVEETAVFGGLRIPSRIRAGNHFGTPDYFPFYIAAITKADYRP